MIEPSKFKLSLLAAIILLLAAAAWFRAPYVATGLPYFYDEDEAHHFDRIVEMVQRGNLNPHYFLKPALHFYLRMPLVKIFAKSRGISTQEIETRDPYGLAGYSFSASHPGAVKLLRLLSEAFSLGAVLGAAILAFLLSGSFTAAALSGVLCALSPALIAHSGLIAVDVMMSFWCVLAVYFSCLAAKKFSWPRLLAGAAFAGLAVSTKYNAAPILAPVAAAALFFGPRRRLALSSALLLPAIVFAVCNPYAIIDMPLFIEHVKSEIIHYAVRGHAGHEGARGLPQAAFYFGFLWREGLSLPAAVLGGGFILWGLSGFRREDAKIIFVFAIFPACYFLLMSLQKVNFIRNMLVMIPFIAVGAAIALERLLSNRPARGLAILALLCLQIPGALVQREAAGNINESRVKLESWIKTERQPKKETAISGELQAARHIYLSRGVDRFDPKAISAEELYLRGFDEVVYGPEDSEPSPRLELLRVLPGADEPQRIVANPRIRIFSLAALNSSPDLNGSALSGDPTEFYISARGENLGCGGDGAQKNEDEDFCWLSRRIGPVRFIFKGARGGDTLDLSIEARSPWQNQALTLSAKGWTSRIKFNDSEAGRWQVFTFKIPSDIVRRGEVVSAQVSEIHSPAREHVGADPRRLGVAIRKVLLAGE